MIVYDGCPFWALLCNTFLLLELFDKIRGIIHFELKVEEIEENENKQICICERKGEVFTKT